MKNVQQRQRGIIAAGYIWLIGAIAVLALLAGLVYGVKSFLEGVEAKGYKRGVDETTAKWSAADLKATTDAEAKRQALQKSIDAEAAKRQTAEKSAQDWETKWRNLANENRRNKEALASVQCPSAAAGPGATPDVRLTWLFVNEYDSAWTGSDGKPLYPDSSGPTQAAGGTGAPGASPYGLDDLIDVHGENSRRFSACLRGFNTLIDTVQGLRDKWGAE